MELRQLSYFDAVVRHGGFTRAAEHLHVAQPAISAQIRRLESELGVTLLARTTRRVQLTHAGELFLARTRRVLAELDAGHTELGQLVDVLRGRVRIGAVEALNPFDLSGALAEFHTRYPGVELVLRSMSMGQQLLTALDADDLDLALGPTPADMPTHFCTQRLFSEELVIITALGHPLALHHSVALAQLRDEPFVCFPPHSGLRKILQDATAPAGFTAHVPFESTSLSGIRDLVSHGLGIALLPRSVAQSPGPAVTTHPIHPTAMHRAIGLIHHRDRQLPPAAHACRNLLAHWPTHSDTPQT